MDEILKYSFGRNVGILELDVWDVRSVMPYFYREDVVVIMPLGLGAKELAEEAVEGAQKRGFEAGYEGEYDLIKVCNYD